MRLVKLCFLMAFGLLAIPAQTLAAVISVPIDHVTIQAAINAAAPGDTIAVANGIYTETLNITKPLVIQGQSEAGVVVNTPDVNGYAVTVTGVSNVTLQNMTFNRPNVLNCTPANTTACYGLKFAGSTGHNIQNITINASPRTGIDLNGVDNSLISGVTVNNTTYENGISLTDSDNNTLSNISTSGNAFGGIGIYTSGALYPPAGATGNTLGGVNLIGETSALYYQKGNIADPYSFIATPGYNFVVLDMGPGTETQGYYADTLPNAITGAENLALLLGGASASTVVIQDLNNPGTTYPDTDLATAGYQSGDVTPPVFSSLTYIARDAGNVPKGAVGGSFYLKENERIYFTININPADTMAAGNNIDFTIGGAAKSTNAFTASPAPTTATTRNKNYVIQAGENGAVGITGVNFTDDAGNAITGLPALPLTTSIIVDTTAPTITSVTQTSSNITPSWVQAGGTVTYTITYSEEVTVSAVNTASFANNATGAVTEVSAANSSSDTLIVTAQAGDNGIVAPVVDFDITDIAGNTTTITNLGAITGGSGSNTITADTTAPTLTSVNISSNNANSNEWAKTGDTITLTLQASEILAKNTVQVSIAGKVATVTNPCDPANCDNYTAAIVVDGTETEGLATFTIDFKDPAQNAGAQATATTDASSVTIDYTAPTLPLVSIVSNNALDTSLAKSNDTITVTFTVADNLATTASISGSPTILSFPAGANVTAVAAGQTIARLTDGTETSEVVVPFSLAVADEAGNVSAITTATTDGSEVKFDRTDPVLRSVKLSATSADSSAFMGDVPTYYAKQNDELKFIMHICDYVDSNSNPPTGTFFGQAVVFTDQGLVGAPGNCTTGAGNASQWRNWRALLPNVDGTEGLVTFAIDPKDNAGNMLIPAVTVTTDGSSIIFDKTTPMVPTDMVDLGGAETAGYKPASNADLYTWTNDDDPAGGTPRAGVYQFDVRYNNANTGINEMVTIAAPTRTFSPAAMIPDLDPYTVNMSVRDKAGNLSTEAVVYTQKYGVEVSGTVTDIETGKPITGAYVNLIAPSGSVCNNPTQEICSAVTDANGNYVLTVAPNTDYKLDVTKVPNYYISKSDLKVTTTDVTTNVQLQHVEDGETQTGNQGTVITLDLAFDDIAGNPQTTYLTAYSFSGDISANKTDDGIVIKSFGDITSVTSNNPDLVIVKISDNEYLVKTSVKILNIADSSNPTSSVSSTYASGSNRVGTRGVLGGASAGFQAGMSRNDRVVNGVWTPAESREFARQLNQGSRYKVNQYVNRNGFTVFAGYQKGRMAIGDMTGSDPNVRMGKQIVFRGMRRGSSTQRWGVAVEDRKEVVKDIFYTDKVDNEPATLVVEEGNQKKAARVRVETKKTELTYNNPEIAGYGRRTEMYPSVYNKKANDARYVNKFARTTTPTTVAPSRMQGKNTNMIVLRDKGRNGKKLVLGQIFNQNPELITQRQRVVRR